MVEDILSLNAATLEAELSYFFAVLDARIKRHFGEASEVTDILEIEPPDLSQNQSLYADLVNHCDFNKAERIVFILSLVPHIKPHMLDIFLSKNASNGHPFTEFGGRIGQHHQGFLPTGETALFILAGENLVKRFTFSYLFYSEHIFYRHDILKLETQQGEPLWSGVLSVSQELLDLVTTGTVRTPFFGMDFPARRIHTELSWEDLVLDSYTLEQTLEIKAWIEYKHKLLNEYELGKKIKPGFRALFYGPPGTGKTLTASLLGKVTAHEVYCIDLAMVVSKYIGETEKNLEKIFLKAEHKEWILFFDEADAMFGKRTTIHDAHDRFANQEVSYLLQRIEGYPGVVLLATNQKDNIDEAFVRRFQTIIHFPMPHQQERYRLWKNAFSTKTPLHENVDLVKIAAEYEVSGGAIMNVVRYTTLMLVQKNRKAITLNDIVEGINKELQKEGRSS